MFARRTTRRGNVFLPFEGMVTALLLFLPCWLFLFAVLEWYQPRGLQLPPIAWPHVAVLIGVCSAIGLVTFMLSIAVPITMGELEALSERVGLGASQIWSGGTVREKIYREVARLNLLLGAGGLAFGGVLLFPESWPTGLRLFGWGALCDLFVIVLFGLVIVPLKTRWPRLGGFAGNPDARYQHAY